MMRPSGYILLGSLVAFAGCVGNENLQQSFGGANSNSNEPNNNSSSVVVIPFAPQPASSYVSKIKNILLGESPTADEVNDVTNDPTAIRNYVSQWMQTPQYQAKMLVFFNSAFQQTQVQAQDFSNQDGELRGYAANNLLQNLHESFGRTVMELISEGQPFTAVATTHRFMLTPPLLVYYGLVDSRSTNDKGQVTSYITTANPNWTLTFEGSGGPIALSDTLNPSSTNYMHWYAPHLSTPSTNPNCTYSNPLVINATTKMPTDRTQTLYRFIMNSEVQVSNPNNTAYSCGPSSSYDPNNAYMLSQDYNNWRMVNIRTPDPNEATTPFYDLTTLRSASEVVFRVPRTGFFTTPAFFAGWQTNTSNQARVTINQTMIVGLNHAIDGTDSTMPPSEAALDAEHAPSSSPCYACHRTLDPMRQFFRHDYSLFFDVQTNPNELALPGMFAFEGVSVAGTSINDLAAKIANHPSFAMAWTQKLCAFANSSNCDSSDPEVQRIAQVFASSNYSWNALVLEMFSSPLVTYAQATQSAREAGVVIPVITKERLCDVLQTRMGLHDPCALQAGTSEPTALRSVPTIAQILPSLQYSRGSATPVFANDPSLFFTAGMENLCSDAASALVDAGTATHYTSSDPNSAISDFVHNLMGVPVGNDATPLSILTDNYQASVKSGAKPTDALRNTFVLACMSPSTIGIGL